MENLEMNNIFNTFKNKRVLVTGHTGFKGSWLSEFLYSIGSDVYGIALDADKLSLYNLINLKSKVNDRLTISFNATGSYIHDEYVANGYGVNESAGVLYSAINYDPTLAVKDEDGNYVRSNILSIDNPVALQEGMTSFADTYRFFASAYGEYKIIDGLTAKLSLGTDFLNENRKNFVSSITQQGQNNGGIGSNQNGEKTNYIIEGTLNYNKTSLLSTKNRK